MEEIELILVTENSIPIDTTILVKILNELKERIDFLEDKYFGRDED